MGNLKFYKMMRAPLEMPKGPKVHWGFAVQEFISGQVLVLHNTPERNVHLDTLDGFHYRQEWSYEEIPYSDAIYKRFLDAVKDKRRYALIANNCQQTYTGIVDGLSWTPMLRFVGIIVASGALIYMTGRRGGAPSV